MPQTNIDAFLPAIAARDLQHFTSLFTAISASERQEVLPTVLAHAAENRFIEAVIHLVHYSQSLDENSFMHAIKVITAHFFDLWSCSGTVTITELNTALQDSLPLLPNNLTFYNNFTARLNRLSALTETEISKFHIDIHNKFISFPNDMWDVAYDIQLKIQFVLLYCSRNQKNELGAVIELIRSIHFELCNNPTVFHFTDYKLASQLLKLQRTLQDHFISSQNVILYELLLKAAVKLVETDAEESIEQNRKKRLLQVTLYLELWKIREKPSQKTYYNAIFTTLGKALNDVQQIDEASIDQLLIAIKDELFKHNNLDIAIKILEYLLQCQDLTRSNSYPKILIYLEIGFLKRDLMALVNNNHIHYARDFSAISLLLKNVQPFTAGENDFALSQAFADLDVSLPGEFSEAITLKDQCYNTATSLTNTATLATASESSNSVESAYCLCITIADSYRQNRDYLKAAVFYKKAIDIFLLKQDWCFNTTRYNLESVLSHLVECVGGYEKAVYESLFNILYAKQNEQVNVKIAKLISACNQALSYTQMLATTPECYLSYIKASQLAYSLIIAAYNHNMLPDAVKHYLQYASNFNRITEYLQTVTTTLEDFLASQQLLTLNLPIQSVDSMESGDPSKTPANTQTVVEKQRLQNQINQLEQQVTQLTAENNQLKRKHDDPGSDTEINSEKDQSNKKPRRSPSTLFPS